MMEECAEGVGFLIVGGKFRCVEASLEVLVGSVEDCVPFSVLF
jgi:hypothetical protein